VPPRRLTYRQIAADMIDRIERGEYQVGQVLPSRSELAAMYSVSRSTADNAMALIIDRGYAYGEPGRGTFVAPE
jgi:GntR family transcriptional regulator